MKQWVLIGLLVVGSWLRFRQIESFAGFDFDQELAVTKATEILQGDLALIGQEVSVGGIFVGPFYNYVTAGLLFISQGDPAVIYYFQALLGVISIWLLYHAAEAVSKGSGWIAALLYVFSWRLLYIDRTAAPSNWLPFLTCLILYLATRSKVKPWVKIVGASCIAGFAAQLHPVGIVLLYIPIWLWWQSKQRRLPMGMASIAAFGLWFTPLILFDIRNNWLNLQGILSRTQTVDYPLLFRFIRQIHLTSDTWITTLTPQRNIWLLSLLILVYISLGKKLKISLFLLTGLLLNPLLFVFYKGKVTDYYLLPSLIFFLCIVSQIIWLSWRQQVMSRLAAIFFLMLFIGLNLSFYVQQKNPYSLAEKKRVMTQIQKEVGDSPVKIHMDTDLGQNNGFKYLAEYYQINASFTHQDPDYVIYVPGSRAGNMTETMTIRVVRNNSY